MNAEERDESFLARLAELQARFEVSWKAGDDPSIDDYCSEAPEDERSEVLLELIGLEIELRIERGDRVTPEDYASRFPQAAREIPRLIAENSPPDVNAALLLGLLALKHRYVEDGPLVGALTDWIEDARRDFGSLLAERCSLAPEQLDSLRELTREFSREHGDDSWRSLAELSSLGPIRPRLERLAGFELTAAAAGFGESRLRGSRFRILRPFEADSKGNLGELFVAQDLELGREVLVKQVKEAHAQHDGMRARFVREAEITGRLEHPGVVPIYGLGQGEDGRSYYAMKLIQGKTLRKAIEEFHARFTSKSDGAGSRPEFRRLLGQFVYVCDTIAYAHRSKVVHRDIKPANVMVGDFGETIVIDWGLAKRFGDKDVPVGSPGIDGPSDASIRTLAGDVYGTPQYMSPEQARGEVAQVGPRSDVYSLGATLYHLLVGAAPFKGGAREVLKLVIKGRFAPPRAANPDVPPGLEAVCLKAMALDPKDRYEGARELARDVERWLADDPVSVRADPWLERASRWIRKHKPVAASLVVAAVLAPVAAAGYAWASKAKQEQKQAETEKELEKQKRDRAEAERTLAVEEQRRAETEKELEKQKRDRAEAERNLALQEQRRAEAEKELEKQKRDRAETEKRLAEQNVLVERYYGLLAPPGEEERLAPGWSFNRLAKLKEAAGIAVPNRDSARLRSELTDARAAVDLRPADKRIQETLLLQPASEAPVSAAGLFRLAAPLASKKRPTGAHAAFSGEGRYLALAQIKTTAPAPFQIRLVDFTNGTARGLWVPCPVGVNQNNGGARRVAFASRGDGLVVAAHYGWIHYWSLSTGRGPVSWRGHDNDASGVVVAPDGTRLFTSSDRQIKRWDLTKPEVGKTPGFELLEMPHAVSDMKATADGKTLVCLTGEGIHLIEAATFRRIRNISVLGLSHLAVSGDGRTVAVEQGVDGASGEGRVLLVDLEHGVPIRRLQDQALASAESHRSGDLDLEFSPDGSLLVTAGKTIEDNSVKIWDVGSGRLILSFRPEGSPRSVRFSPDGRKLVIATSDVSTLYEVGGAGACSTLALNVRPTTAVALDPTSRLLACAVEPRAGDGVLSELTVWDMATRSRTHHWTSPAKLSVVVCSGLAFHPDGGSLVSSWESADEIMVSRLSDQTHSQIPAPRALASGFSDDGLFSVAGEGVQAWSTPGFAARPGWGNTFSRVFTGRDNLNSFFVGRNWIVAGGRDGSFFSFRTSEFPKLGGKWTVSGHPVTGAAIDPSEKLVAGGSHDGAVSLFRLATGEPVARAEIPHRGAVMAVAFSPDGTLLASGGEDRRIRLWRIGDNSLTELLSLKSLAGPIHTLRFTNDGRNLVVAARDDAAVRLWNLEALRAEFRPLGLDWK